MNLCFLIPSIKRLGPINVVFDLCLSLNTKCNITLISIQPEIYGDAAVDFSISGVSDILFLSSNNLVGKYFELRSILNSRKFDVIHSHCFFPDVFNALLLTKGSKVTTLHNFLYFDYKFEYGNFKGLILSFMHRMSLKRIKNVVGCSKSVMDVTKICDAFIRNGVHSKTLYRPVGSKLKFIYVGRLIERKNISMLVKAFSVFSNVELHIVGDGPLLNDLQSIAGSNIFFHGFVPDPSIFYSDVDFFVSASFAEGLPLSLLEALSFSLCYLVSDILPHKEIHDLSCSGFVVENNFESWVSTIKNVCSLSDYEINQMKLKSVDSFNKNFSFNVMADSYYRYYKYLGQKNA